ncbi:hypothetical protein Q5752_006593 [Cryptotrichosporon argae]
MTTLIDIPSCTAYHIPTPGSSPLPLSSGDLSLTVLPAQPPAKPAQTITLTVGGASFTLLPTTPVQKTSAKDEHASYVFSPAPADGSGGIGQVRVHMKDSKSQGEWEATEALCAKLEHLLRVEGVWEDKVLFVDDEYETGGPRTQHKGWGEAIAGAVLGAGHALADRLTGYTDKHIEHTDPVQPAPPSEGVASAARRASEATSTVASYATAGAAAIGNTIHDAGKAVGSALPDAIARPAEPVPEADKTAARKAAEGQWAQAAIAARGIAGAAVEVASAVSGSAHRAIEHNFGKEAEGVAQDIGQAGANLASTGAAAFKGTSVIVQGTNAATGIAATREGDGADDGAAKVDEGAVKVDEGAAKVAAADELAPPGANAA